MLTGLYGIEKTIRTCNKFNVALYPSNTQAGGSVAR